MTISRIEMTFYNDISRIASALEGLVLIEEEKRMDKDRKKVSEDVNDDIL